MNEHGEYSFEWQGSILILHLRGSFNTQAIVAFFSDVMRSLNEQQKPAWALLSSIDRDMMGTPEVVDIIKQAYRFAETYQCIGAAISGANSIIQNIFTDYFQHITYPTALFDTQPEAIIWLESLFIDTDSTASIASE